MQSTESDDLFGNATGNGTGPGHSGDDGGDDIGGIPTNIVAALSVIGFAIFMSGILGCAIECNSPDRDQWGRGPLEQWAALNCCDCCDRTRFMLDGANG